MELHMEQSRGIEFLCEEKTAPTDLHQHLLKVDGNAAVAVSAVRWWVLCFSSGGSNGGSPLLMQIVTSTACRILFTVGEST